MTNQEAIATKPTGLALLRQPFPPHQISKLPKPTRQQTDAVKADFKQGIRCPVCGLWHHPKVVHLDYVGHAALTDRLLDCDPAWNWEPLALNERGTPLLDENGGMWIRLTVCGQTRLGYGHPDGKKGGDAIKEVIGDALRNAAMRFGAALDFWHKGDLHGDPEPEPADAGQTDAAHADAAPADQPTPEAIRDRMKAAMAGCQTMQALTDTWGHAGFRADLKSLPAPMKSEIEAEKNRMKAALGEKPETQKYDDEIPF